MRWKYKSINYSICALISCLIIIFLSGLISNHSSIPLTLQTSLTKGSYIMYEPENTNPVDENAVSQNIYVNSAFSNASDMQLKFELLPLRNTSRQGS